MLAPAPESSGYTFSLYNDTPVDCKPDPIADKDDVAQRELIMLENARVCLPAFVERVLSSQHNRRDYLLR